LKNQIPKILIWGGRSKAKIINQMILENKIGSVEIVFDESLDKPYFESESIFINDIDILKQNIKIANHYVVCIGSEHGFARYSISKTLEEIGLHPIDIRHKTSFIDKTSNVGKACQIMPYACVHKFATVDSYTIINTRATIDHECRIGKGVHIMGSAAIAGKVDIEDFVTVGTNSTILPNLKIGTGAIIGAGAVVTKNVDPYSVVVGIPAKHVRDNKFTYNSDLTERILKK